MNLILFLYRQSCTSLLFSTLAVVLSGFSSATMITVIGKCIQAKSAPKDLALEFFLLCAASFATKYYADISLLRLTQSAVFKLRVELCRKLLASPLKQLHSLGKSRLIVILTSDVGTFVQGMQMLPSLLSSSIILVCCMVYLAWVSLEIFLATSVCLLVGTTVFHVAERRPLAQMVAFREKWDVLFANFRSLIDGSKELKLNAGRGKMFVDGIITDSAADVQSAFLHGVGGYTLVQNSGAIFFYLTLGLLLFVLPSWIQLSAEVYPTVALIVLYMAQPISTIMGALPSLRQSMIALKKIEQLDNTLLSEPAPCGATDFVGDSPLTLELRGVCHQYPGATEDRPFLLGPIDFTIHAGELLFVVGGNGSGKTTLAMLLLGLYPPESGAIHLNGHEVTQQNVGDYRQHFSAVFADFHLFEELLETESEALTAKTNHYLKALEMAHKVRLVDGKFSTINLSTGQQKRLALIASYLEDRPIYLFDEWAADQDPAFKRVFYTELLPELKARGKTVIVITHDDAYFSCADRVIKLQDGALKPFFDEPAAVAPRPDFAGQQVQGLRCKAAAQLE